MDKPTDKQTIKSATSNQPPKRQGRKLRGKLSVGSRFLSLSYIIIVVYSISTTPWSDNLVVVGPEQTLKQTMTKLKMPVWRVLIKLLTKLKVSLIMKEITI